MPEQEYLYANNPDAEERARLDRLEEENDPRSIRALETVGVGPGWRCLEVGAGGGSIARWLADRVAPGGHVVATDIDPRFLAPFASDTLEIRTHDILADPLEENAYDLVHSRFLLEHLPEHHAALERMIGALKPGGWLVAEDVDFLDMEGGHAIVAPAEARSESADLWKAMRALAEGRGILFDHGRRLPLHFREHGLEEIGARAERSFLFGGTRSGELARRSVSALRPALLAQGIDPAVLERQVAALDDPATLGLAPMIVSAWGRKPAR